MHLVFGTFGIAILLLKAIKYFRDRTIKSQGEESQPQQPRAKEERRTVYEGHFEWPTLNDYIAVLALAFAVINVAMSVPIFIEFQPNYVRCEQHSKEPACASSTFVCSDPDWSTFGGYVVRASDDASEPDSDCADLVQTDYCDRATYAASVAASVVTYAAVATYVAGAWIKAQCWY